MIADYQQSSAEAPAGSESAEVSSSQAQRPPPGWLVPGATLTLIALANCLAISGLRVPFLGPALGFWFLVVYPAYLLYTSALWRNTSVPERAGYSITAWLLILLLAGLFVNFALPLAGIHRPLDSAPVTVVADFLIGALYLLRRRFPAPFGWRSGLRSLSRQETRLVVWGASAAALAVLGATRLNNNAGDTVSLVALACIVITVALLLGWQRYVRDGMAAVTIYLTSLALLLMTSLRGWYVTGHDIQYEYRVFQLTAAHGHWSISGLRDAYNACLSITILPTEFAGAIHVADPYIFKVFFQLIFAACPALVFAISRRHWSRPISILAAVFFAGFPTFFTDMPFMNRQEIGFLFVSAAILAFTNTGWPQGRRRLVLLAAGLGMELSHYSTMYVFVGTLLATWVIGTSVRLERRRRRAIAHEADAARPPRWTAGVRTIGAGSIAGLALLVVFWGGLATGTAGSAVSTTATAIGGVYQNSGSTGPYSLFSSATVSLPALLNNYQQVTLKTNAVTPSDLRVYSPADISTPIVNEPQLPLTAAGRLLARVGISAATVNTAVRQGAAKDEQLFVVVGLIAFLAARRVRRRLPMEYVALSGACLVFVGIFTVFPMLSVDYGGLRAFQEALIVISPMLVAGSMTVFSLFGQTWSRRIATAVCLTIFASTIGLLPQLLGDYPAQLSLNNSGQYFDIYYQHPQEVAAVDWLAGKPGVLPRGLQASMGPTTADMFAFTGPSSVSGRQVVGDIFPTEIGRSSWVILGYSTVRDGLGVLYTNGQIITYQYPISFVANGKNLVYDNGGAEIYK
jgi:uncharacterized membrane protein